MASQEFLWLLRFWSSYTQKNTKIHIPTHSHTYTKYKIQGHKYTLTLKQRHTHTQSQTHTYTKCKDTHTPIKTHSRSNKDAHTHTNSYTHSLSHTHINTVLSTPYPHRVSNVWHDAIYSSIRIAKKIRFWIVTTKAAIKYLQKKWIKIYGPLFFNIKMLVQFFWQCYLKVKIPWNTKLHFKSQLL